MKYIIYNWSSKIKWYFLFSERIFLVDPMYEQEFKKKHPLVTFANFMDKI
ncbi:hypothetical protein SATMO3_21450 [Sporomusa aerivorans]